LNVRSYYYAALGASFIRRAMWMNSLSFAKAWRTCSTLTKRVLSWSPKFNKGQLVLPSRIHRRPRLRRRRVSRMKCRAGWKEPSSAVRMKRLAQKLGVQGAAGGARGRENDRPLQAERKWQVEGLLRLRGRIVCNRHSRTCPVPYSSKISNACECAEILPIALFLTLSRATFALLKTSRGTRDLDWRTRSERKNERERERERRKKEIKTTSINACELLRKKWPPLVRSCWTR